jgi:hypothetical protein
MANPSPSSVKPSGVRSHGAPLSASPAASPPVREATALGDGQLLTLVLSWAGVGLPLAWGVLQTLEKALALFK